MLKNIGRRNLTCLNDENLTLNESHVKNDSTITIGKNDVKGGGGDEFANLSKEFIRKDEVLSSDSKEVPDWRYICKGINLYGFANKKIV